MFVALVGNEEDALIIAVAEGLRGRNIPYRHLHPRELAYTSITLRGDEVLVDGRRVSGLLLRHRPHEVSARSYREQDRAFAVSETKAAWLAIANSTGIHAPIRPSAELWQSPSDWPLWRRRFLLAGVPLAPMLIGAATPTSSWVPYTQLTRFEVPNHDGRRVLAAAAVDGQEVLSSLVCLGEVIAGVDGPSVRRAARVLAGDGAAIAAIMTIEDGRVHSCTSHPYLAEPAAKAAAGRLVDGLCGY